MPVETDRCLEDLVADCESRFYDVRLEHIAAWKKEDPARRAVGCLPVYTPLEIVLGSGVRPVRLMGGGDRIPVIRGDSYYQSYICHFPRSVVELGLGAWKTALDGLICPATCDVIRNLSGMWQVLFPDKLVHYLDVPQNFRMDCGGAFYRRELENLADKLCALAGTQPVPDRYRETIALFNENRRAIRQLADLRIAHPNWIPAWEYHLVVRAGDTMDVAAHTALIREYTHAARQAARPEQDNARILVVGAFCEQPPLNLIRTIERSGCYIVEEDFTLGSRWIEGDVEEDGDPFDALAAAYLEKSAHSSIRYEGDEPKTERLLRKVEACRADGVLLMSPSFCDPSMLDRPHFMRTLEEAGVPFATIEYAENLGQFQNIREQTGTFSEAIKLWGAV